MIHEYIKLTLGFSYQIGIDLVDSILLKNISIVNAKTNKGLSVDKLILYDKDP